ncbi:MAG: M23 family metallopeptidase [Candidatus Aenigmarchaeota archaeon]|nr:M23 family metallopeptidase [Candidatus Aenigmarchaeota archaeon]
MKAAINLIGLVTIGTALAAVIIMIHGVPHASEMIKVNSETSAYINVNDETSKLMPILESGNISFAAIDQLACDVLGITYHYQDDYIDAVLKSMDAGIIVYAGGMEKKTYGNEKSDKLFADIPLPGGKIGNIALMVDIPRSISEASFGSNWIWPLETLTGMHVSHCYGEYRELSDGSTYTHSGVDLGGNIGDNVHAVADGEVIFVCDNDERELTDEEKNARIKGNCSGYGNNIIIKHAGLYARYSHLHTENGVLVSVGDIVTQNQIIGRMGSTGRSFGAHLDFKVYSYEPYANGASGYDANIDPLCMYTPEYLKNVVKLTYEENDKDCQQSKLCIKYRPSIYTDIVEEDLTI